MRRFAALLIVLAALAVPSFAFASKGSASTCSTHGLSFSTMRVVGLTASGIRCSAARSVAVKIVRELGRGQSLSVSGDESFAMSQSTCSGCKTTTSVSIHYPSGTLSISIRGGKGSTAAGGPTAPLFPSGGPTNVY